MKFVAREATPTAMSTTEVEEAFRMDELMSHINPSKITSGQIL